MHATGPTQISELISARAMVARLVDHWLEPETGPAESKVFVPLIFRGIKLVSDLLKQLGGEGSDDEWDEVLDRLNEELGIDAQAVLTFPLVDDAFPTCRNVNST